MFSLRLSTIGSVIIPPRSRPADPYYDGRSHCPSRVAAQPQLFVEQNRRSSSGLAKSVATGSSANAAMSYRPPLPNRKGRDNVIIGRADGSTRSKEPSGSSPQSGARVRDDQSGPFSLAAAAAATRLSVKVGCIQRLSAQAAPSIPRPTEANKNPPGTFDQ